MIGISHLIIVLFGIGGLLLGGVLIDLGHKGTLCQKWNGFLGRGFDDCLADRGWIHKPMVMFSMIMFSICFGFSLLLHYLMDYV